MRKMISILLLLGACHGPVPEAARVPFDPVGRWESPSGFALDIRADGSYTACDDGVCNTSRYAHYGAEQLILRNFFSMPAAQNIINVAEIRRFCPRERCAGPPNPTYIYYNDLYFLPNVAPVDHARKCGKVQCVILGNVEVRRGTLYKRGSY
jgi:hypothetical protein